MAQLRMLPQTAKTQIPDHLIYLSFRAAWLETLDAVIDQVSLTRSVQRPGFLEQIPLFAGCAPQIQLALLFQTWTTLRENRELSPLQQCVCYCALEEFGRLGVLEHHRRLKEIAAGPLQTGETDFLWLGSRIRTILVTLPIQFQHFEAVADLSSLSEQLDERGSENDLRMEIIQHLGRWHVGCRILDDSCDLLTIRERQTLNCLLKSSQILNDAPEE